MNIILKHHKHNANALRWMRRSMPCPARRTRGATLRRVHARARRRKQWRQDKRQHPLMRGLVSWWMPQAEALPLVMDAYINTAEDIVALARRLARPTHWVALTGRHQPLHFDGTSDSVPLEKSP